MEVVVVHRCRQFYVADHPAYRTAIMFLYINRLRAFAGYQHLFVAYVSHRWKALGVGSDVKWFDATSGFVFKKKIGKLELMNSTNGALGSKVSSSHTGSATPA